MSEYMKEINGEITKAAKKLLDNAFENIAKRLPDDSKKEDFLARIYDLEEQGIQAMINGQDYQKYIERGAYETSVWLATHYADAALKRIASNLPHGKIKDEIFSALQELSHVGIEGICSGNSIEQVKESLKNSVKGQLKSYVEKNCQKWDDDIGESMYRSLKTSGHGSRKTNRYIKAGTDIFSAELGSQLVVNFTDVLDGNKSVKNAAVDVVKNATMNTGKQYAKKKGAEIAADAMKELAKRAEKEISNRTVQRVATTALEKLSDANTIMQVAGVAVDIGKALKRLMDGEITKTDFLRIVGEKGTAFVVSGVYSALGAAAGAAIGGPIGAMVGSAIGSAVGYLSTSLLYGSVMQAFDEAEISRKRYEAIHEFCEYSIAEMERQRREFVRVTSKLFENRQRVIEYSLSQYEKAIRCNDFNEMSSALNEIATEFGGKLQFRNMEEFDQFMSDDDTVFEL